MIESIVLNNAIVVIAIISPTHRKAPQLLSTNHRPWVCPPPITGLGCAFHQSQTLGVPSTNHRPSVCLPPISGLPPITGRRIVPTVKLLSLLLSAAYIMRISFIGTTGLPSTNHRAHKWVISKIVYVLSLCPLGSLYHEDILTPMLLVANFAKYKMTQKNWKRTKTLAYGYPSESTAWALQFIPTWQGLGVFQKSLHPCALDERSLSIWSVKQVHLTCLPPITDLASEWDITNRQSVYLLYTALIWSAKNFT